MKKNKKWMIVAGTVLALCLIAAGIFGLSVNGAERRLAKQLELGQRYLNEMNYEQAIAAYEHAIAIDPKCADAYHGMAVAYAGMGDYEKSLENFDKLLELDGENERALNDLEDCLREYIEVLLREKRYDEIKDLEEKYGDLAVSEELRRLLEEAVRRGEADFPANEEREEAGMADAEPVQVTIKRTEIQADSVYNLEGYGCINIKGVGNYVEDYPESVIMPQTALIDADGNFVFPYKSTYLRYRISDGIISLTESTPYATSGTDYYDWDMSLPEYYNFDGSSVFVPKSTENEVDQDAMEYGVTYIVGRTWRGGPMQDGYALVIEIVETNYIESSAGGMVDPNAAESLLADFNCSSGGGGMVDPHALYIVDKSGTITCTLPEEFSYVFGISDSAIIPEYWLGVCGEGLFALLEKNGVWREAKGYLDTAGNMALDLSGRGYTGLGPFHEGLAVVGSEGGYGYINKAGELVIPCIYDNVMASFGEDGLTAVKKDGMWGFIGRDGNIVIPCIYDAVNSNFSEDGLAAVNKDGKWGYIGRDGNVVIPFEYDGAYGAAEGLAAVVKDGKCGLVDYSNRVIVPLEYDDISSCEGGAGYAIKDGYVYIISK